MFIKTSFILNKARLRGNIIAITLLIGGIAGVTALTLSALILSDTQVYSQIEDSEQAYQAASAGAELGLLYQRFNRNSEYSSGCNLFTGQCSTTPTNQNDLSNANDNAIRIYLDRLGCTIGAGNSSCNHVDINNSIQTGIYSLGAPNTLSDSLPANERVVDIKIYYKATEIGNHTKLDTIGYTCDSPNPPADCNPTIDRDETYQINGLENSDVLKLYLRPKTWASALDNFINNNPQNPQKNPPNPKFSGIDYSFYQSFCQQNIDTNIKSSDVQNDKCAYYLTAIPSTSAINSNFNEVVGIRRAFNYNPTTKRITNPLRSDNTVRIRPLNMDATFAAQVFEADGVTPKKIDSGISHIIATGYYGKAKRTLEVQIDRNSNSFMGIFDRALYVGTGGLKP